MAWTALSPPPFPFRDKRGRLPEDVRQEVRMDLTFALLLAFSRKYLMQFPLHCGKMDSLPAPTKPASSTL
eukprot:24207-Pleurochrysis_carterae.AAC.1